MTLDQVEKTVIELIHREPFVPFEIEYFDGKSLMIPHPRLAVNVNGAVFFGLDDALVDVDFDGVRSIRVVTPEAA